MATSRRSASDRSLLKTLGENVRAQRHALGLSQEELADRARLHRTYVGGIERGERNVSLLNIARIAEALDTTPSRLVDGSR